MKTFFINWKVTYKEGLNYSRVATVGPYHLGFSSIRWGLYYVLPDTNRVMLRSKRNFEDVQSARKELIKAFTTELARFEAAVEVVDPTTPEALLVEGAREGDSFTSVEEYLKLAVARGDIPKRCASIFRLQALEAARNAT